MINVGIIGGGSISETHARAAHETDGVEVAAVYGENQGKTSRLAERFGARAYATLAEFLDHDPLDVVLIGSPSGLHAEQGIAAAKRGLHVLVEKPVDITTERVDALLNHCAQAGVKLGVFFQDRVAPDIQRLKRLLLTETLGTPMLISARVKWYRPPEYYSGSRWRGTAALDGGGALMNQGVHTVDLLLWLMGDVTRVSARTATALHEIEVEDTVVATLEFANGAIGTLEAATSVYPGYPRRLELTGTEGTIVLEHDRIVAADLRNANIDLLPVSKDSNPSATSPVLSDVSGHKKLLEDFLRAIQTNGRPLCDGVEGRRSVALVQAIYESARTGQAVTL
ncbi:MAG TPA: Gfo/Idh/MocA family oxidoreductase [Pyrinomonadaceae bacterium]|jgi:predicted dehydrogenase|nr:Gfo/Idh/MocA family oxidoreductase [Pyrinomonadaceae bacterium]